MQVALSINARDASEARDLALRAIHIVPQGGIIHIDISDGIYTANATWDDAVEWRTFAPHGIKTEVHLMARDWESRLVSWLNAGAFRIIIQADLADKDGARRAKEIVSRYGAELMLSFPLHDDTHDFSPYAAFTAFQVLAVPAGKSGQKFDERALQKINALRAAFPNAILEVDGGITPVIATRVADAGANIVVSSSYIWNATSPKQAYEQLERM